MWNWKLKFKVDEYYTLFKSLNYNWIAECFTNSGNIEYHEWK